ncbi:MAG: hypothetical protein PHO56_03820 [Patescibacteria group bacterium]|nr:hypothetical protein [Patescibacteria group bacterium]
MRTNSPFNIDNPFPNPEQVRPIEPKAKIPPLNCKKEEPEKKKNKKREKPDLPTVKLPPPNPFGEKGRDIDLLA